LSNQQNNSEPLNELLSESTSNSSVSLDQFQWRRGNLCSVLNDSGDLMTNFKITSINRSEGTCTVVSQVNKSFIRVNLTHLVKPC
jgi:hypothetical protein